MFEYVNIENINNLLIEARTTLTHTLHLIYEPASIRAELNQSDCDNKINIMCKYMHESCLPLFSTTAYTPMKGSTPNGLNEGSWTFFGDFKSPLPENGTAPGKLSFLSFTGCHEFWMSILTHHCLLATYDKLHETIFHDSKINGYNLSRLFSNCGFHYSLKNEFFHINIENNNFIVKELNHKTRNGVVDSDTASNYGRNSYPPSFATIEKTLKKCTHYKNLSEQIQLKTDTKNGQKTNYTSVTIPMSSIPFFSQLKGEGNRLKNICKLYDVKTKLTPSGIKRIIENINDLQDKIQKSASEEDAHMTKTDILYYKYKLEQIFNFDLVYCLSKNIINLGSRTNQQMHQKIEFIELISSVVQFPNTFSRPLLVQIAFDCCSDYFEPDSSILQKMAFSPDTVIGIDKRTRKTTDSYIFFNQWKNCFINFVTYMTELVFPIYESYFFVMMYDLFSISENSPAQNILDLYLRLGNYLSSDIVFNQINSDYYANEIIKIYRHPCRNKQEDLTFEHFILPDYTDSAVVSGTFKDVALSIYNHTPAPVPPLISRKFLYKYFPHARECFLKASIVDFLS